MAAVMGTTFGHLLLIINFKYHTCPKIPILPNSCYLSMTLIGHYEAIKYYFVRDFWKKDTVKYVGAGEKERKKTF